MTDQIPEECSTSSARIGILDSGVGGLSVLKEIRTRLPRASLHYVGDSEWCPYGNKPPEQICERVTSIADYLIGYGADLLVIACNSATIHAVGPLRALYPIPIVGMEPGVKPAAEQTQSGVIGVLATEASIAGEKFHQLVNRHAEGIKVITCPCPRFVELVESGQLEGPEVDAAVSEVLTPLLAMEADVIVLGCTHYPFLSSAIEQQLPDEVVLIDTGPAVADRVVDQIPTLSNVSKESPQIIIETTGSLGLLNELLPSVLSGSDVLTQSVRL
ncbi:MAG: glutamate racemase [Verrucomicrobiota bacterium]